MALSVSKLSLGELVWLTRLKRDGLESVLSRMNFTQMMEFRKEIQIALTHFAKGKPALSATQGDILNPADFTHAVQWKALGLCKYIERKVRNAYLATMRPMIIMRYPEFAKNPQKVKSLTLQKWEKFCKKHSY